MRKLTASEMELVSKVASRTDININPFVLMADFAIDNDAKFTTCILADMADPKKLYIGNSKRATYPRMADSFNEETGRNISLARATKNLLEKGGCCVSVKTANGGE